MGAPCADLCCDVLSQGSCQWLLARPPQVVQDTGLPQGTGRMGDLLGQFNVATFKTSE